jgi:hypothetical protein
VRVGNPHIVRARVCDTLTYLLYIRTRIIKKKKRR